MTPEIVGREDELASIRAFFDQREGGGFVDEGGHHVHKIVNKGGVAARTIAVQFLPAGAGRRIDADEPDCH